MGRIIGMEYRVPVYCYVDIEDGTVVKVVEDGGSIESTGNLVDEMGMYFEEPGAWEVVQQIAEDNDWPAWERE